MADSSTNPSVSLSALRVQVIQQLPGEIALPKGKTGLVMFTELRDGYLPMTAFDRARVTQSGPVQVTGVRTKVTFAATPHSIFRGTVDMTYDRYPISVLNNTAIPGGGFTSVEHFITYLRGLSYMVENGDFDLVKSIRRDDGTVSIYPSKTSWLFSPDGSYDSSDMPKIENILTNLVTDDFDRTPPLHLGIVNGELSGFEVVPPMVLGDEIIVDELSGFTPVGGQ